MSDLEDTLYVGMSEALETAVNVSREIVYHNHIVSWEDHCEALEAEIARLEACNIDLEVLSEKMDVIIEGWEELVAERDAEIKAGEDAMQAVQNQASSYAITMENYRHYLVGLIDEKGKKTDMVNGMIAAYAEIFKQLSDEVTAIGDPSKYTMMDPVKRNKVIVSTFANFIRSGQENYAPDLDFTFLKNLKASQQAQCAAP